MTEPDDDPESEPLPELTEEQLERLRAIPSAEELEAQAIDAALRGGSG